MLRVIQRSEYQFSDREIGFDQALAEKVREIIVTVRQKGDEALQDLTEKFDGIRLPAIRVPEEAIEEALDKLSPMLRNSMERAIENIKAYHLKTGIDSWQETQKDGETKLGLKVTPIDRVGIYIPGGKASYPSTVAMNVIPALIAEVPSIALFSPPARKGLPSDEILGIAALLGINEIYAVGGAQSVAAMAYGTETIQRVNKVFGPGNAFVAEAKRQVFGTVGIDSLAGPSEIVILHDDTEVPPEYIARDLLSQAEHDERAMSLLVTTDKDTAEKVAELVNGWLPKLPRKEVISKSLENYGRCIVCDSMDEALELVNEIAPEHLEVFIKNREDAERIRNAGAIFFGKWSSEPIGDYFAGPNHTIPTNGAAKFSSPLSVRDFQKTTSWIEYSEYLFKEHAEAAAIFAEAEGLPAHAEALRCRLD